MYSGKIMERAFSRSQPFAKSSAKTTGEFRYDQFPGRD